MGIDIMRGSLGSRWRWIYSWRALYHHSCSPALYPTTHWNGLRPYWSAWDMVPKGHWTLCNDSSDVLFNHHQPNSSDCFEQFDKRIKLHPGKSSFILIIEIMMMEIEVTIHHLEMMFLLETGYFPSSFRGQSQKHHWVAVRVFRSLKWSITCCMFHPNVVMTT